MGDLIPFRQNLQDQLRLIWNWPSLESRVTINGKTGSGKTVAGSWLLSEAEFDKQPFVIIDYKRDKLFAQIERLKEIGIDEIPDYSGLYHLKALPHQDEEMEAWLWKVWNKGEIGLFIDEGYLIPDGRAFKTILVTGRSLHIPVYTLSQRPVKVNRFVFSEADFYQCFRLNDARDREVVEGFTPSGKDDGDPVWAEKRRLPKYHSRWYDVNAELSCILGPAPRVEHILQRFDDRLRPRKRII